MAFLAKFESLALALTAVAAWIAVCGFVGHLLHDEKKALLGRWLKGDFDDAVAGATWITHFINLFEAAFGTRPLSVRFFLRSAIASLLTVFTLYVVFLVTGLIDSGRAEDHLSLSLLKVLLIGSVLNIIPDYLSLIETRWILNRFKHWTRIRAHIALLLLDLVLTGLIIYAAIWIFQSVAGQAPVNPVELLVAYNVLAVFFFSTFVTSVWSWIYCITTWFMRLFSRTPLLRDNWINSEMHPMRSVTMVGSLLLFVGLVPLSIALTAEGEEQMTWLDRKMCSLFPNSICSHVFRFSRNEKDLIFACKASSKQCVDNAFNFYGGDRDKVILLYGTACSAGIPSACARASNLYKESDELKSKELIKKAIELYTKDCDGGDVESCFGFGSLYTDGSVERDVSKAVVRFKQSCDGGYVKACNNLGYLYDKDDGIKREVSKAITLYTKACDGGDLAGCVNLGNLYLGDVDGIKRDLSKAMTLFAQGCDGGIGGGCSSLAYRYLGNDGVSRDVSKAATLYERACNVGEMKSCFDLGLLYMSGTGVSRDVSKAATLYERACNGRVMTACSQLGLLYANGDVMERDKDKAVARLTQACNGQEMKGCFNLGLLYANGDVVERDISKAVTLYAQACDGGHSGGCYNLGSLYFQGDGVTRDLPKSVIFITRSCENGYLKACENLGGVYLDGIYLDDVSIPRDVLRAETLFSQACSSGENESCLHLGMLYAQGIRVALNLVEPSNLVEPIPQDHEKAMELLTRSCNGGILEACSILNTIQ